MNLRDFIDQARAGEVEEPEGPLTAGRQKRRAAYRDYYHANPEQTLKDQARQSKYQSDTRTTADRHGDAWTTADRVRAMDVQTPLEVTAEDVSRTYAATRQGRYRIALAGSLPNSLVKREEDEYSALIRRVDITTVELMGHRAKWEAIKSHFAPEEQERRLLESRIKARSRKPWTRKELDLLGDRSITARELSTKIARTPGAIGLKRSRMNRGIS